MNDVLRYDLAELIQLPRTRVTTRDLIPPVVYRLARKRTWNQGKVPIEVRFRRGPDTPMIEHKLLLQWDLAAISARYREIHEDLKRIASTKNDQVITEQAAIGIAFVLVTALLPEDTITRVVQLGGHGDFFLNGNRFEMIEICGTKSGPLNKRFDEKRAQIRLNRSLTKAWVCVSQFSPPRSRLERVR